MSRWKTVAIVGVGLIGGSIGLALRRRALAEKVVGIGRHEKRLAKAVDCKAISEWTTDVALGVRDAEIVVICTPVQHIAHHVLEVAEHCKPDTVITDAGSTKERVLAEIENQRTDIRFVGSHPLAGSDKSGVEFSDAKLFVDRAVIVTPTKNTAAPNVDMITEFWQSLGARVAVMDPARHDLTVAITSHLPHVLASGLAAETPETFLPFVAGGWLDTTRVAAADTELWAQILQENNTNVVTALRQFRTNLERFESALMHQDQESLTRQLAEGKRRRDAVGN